MKMIRILVMVGLTLLMISTGYTAGTEAKESIDSSSIETSEDRPEMMHGMHGKEMKQKGMKSHHMMHPGMSPVTVVIYPGMTPMMGYSMMQQGKGDGHKGSSMKQEKMEQHGSKMKKHMDHMEQRLANIERLLAELVELQKKD